MKPADSLALRRSVPVHERNGRPSYMRLLDVPPTVPGRIPRSIARFVLSRNRRRGRVRPGGRLGRLARWPLSALVVKFGASPLYCMHIRYRMSPAVPHFFDSAPRGSASADFAPPTTEEMRLL
jgi:hypothetical protein